MLVDAVLPAASEVVMVYAGAIAAGAFAGQSVTLFGYEFESGFPAYVAMSLAGTIGYLIGSIGGWWLGVRLGRPWLEQHGRWFHLDTHKLDRAERWFDRWEGWAVFIGRVSPVVRSFISIPAGVFKARFWPYFWLTLLGSAIWCFAFAGAGWAAGANWEKFHDAFKYVEYLDRGRDRRGRRVPRLALRPSASHACRRAGLSPSGQGIRPGQPGTLVRS